MKLVLVVDDIRTDRELIGRIVSSLGHQVAFAENGQEAVAKAHELQPALILMDVVMPVQDGFAACRKLKRHPETSHIPVVLVSTKSSSTDQLWGKRQGAEAYLVKPFEREDLTDLVRRYAA